MDNALETLFIPFEEYGLPAGPIAFLNARYHPFLNAIKDRVILQQYFKPCARELEARGFSSAPGIQDKNLAAAFVLLPKNAVEARALIARGLSLLTQNGLLICAAANKAGGTRIKKMLKEFGLEDIGELSKNRARSGWGEKTGMNAAAQTALENGIPQKILNGDFISMPGIFGWDKIDKGSEMLVKHLPLDLKGRGADFGCGYGYLARHVLKANSAIEKLYCIDADWRAVEMARQNLKDAASCEFLWEDLTAPPPAKNLDFIVMNPPFHEGKKTDAGIGAAFIKNASLALKSGGALWMVANANLPYEAILRASFTKISKISEGQGYKIFRAVK